MAVKARKPKKPPKRPSTLPSVIRPFSPKGGNRGTFFNNTPKDPIAVHRKLRREKMKGRRSKLSTCEVQA